MILSQGQWATKSQAKIRTKIVYNKLLQYFETGNRALNIVSINNQFITTSNISIFQLLATLRLPYASMEILWVTHEM